MQAAPFSAQAVEEILPLLSFLILNEVEAGQLTEATGKSPQDLGIGDGDRNERGGWCRPLSRWAKHQELCRDQS